MISTADFRNGLTFIWEGAPQQVLWFQHHKPGKGGAVMRVKLKNLRTGSIVERTFKSGERFEDAVMERRKKQFLYKDAEGLHFMDVETYEQAAIQEESIGQAAQFLKEEMEVDTLWFDGQIIGVDLPTKVELRITATEPGMRGDTANMPMKPATLETGAEIKVPLFVKEGDLIRLDTRTGEYIERA